MGEGKQDFEKYCFENTTNNLSYFETFFGCQTEFTDGNRFERGPCG